MSDGGTVLVVGAGVAGAACAGALASAGVGVRVVDRGHRAGGRMAARHVPGPGGEPRPVDLGAAYLTVRDDGFRRVVDDWHGRGLLRPWTEELVVAGPDGPRRTTRGPLRWAAPAGLRSLVEDLLARLPPAVLVEQGRAVERVDAAPDGSPRADGEPYAAVVLAAPDPQVERLLGDGLDAERATVAGRAWEPVVAVHATWARRWWPALDAAFVEDHPLLALVADDGARRGDGVPVLVAHTTADGARAHLDDPDGAIAPVLAALGPVLGASPGGPPEHTGAQRWTFARPVSPRDEPFHLGPARVGICGDGWGSRPRVEQAWLSGDALGRELAGALSAG